MKTMWKVYMRPQQEAFEVCAPGANERVHLSVLLTALAPSKVKGVEPASQDKDGDMIPKQHRIAFLNGRHVIALEHTGSLKQE